MRFTRVLFATIKLEIDVPKKADQEGALVQLAAVAHAFEILGWAQAIKTEVRVLTEAPVPLITRAKYSPDEPHDDPVVEVEAAVAALR
jgi:hypothetical protein